MIHLLTKKKEKNKNQNKNKKNTSRALSKQEIATENFPPPWTRAFAFLTNTLASNSSFLSPFPSFFETNSNAIVIVIIFVDNDYITIDYY